VAEAGNQAKVGEEIVISVWIAGIGVARIESNAEQEVTANVVTSSHDAAIAEPSRLRRPLVPRADGQSRKAAGIPSAARIPRNDMQEREKIMGV
jgi:hypothetical protein